MARAASHHHHHKQESMMKLTRNRLKEMLEEVMSESDGHPQILKKNREVAHN